MRKVMALLLTFALVLGLTVSAFAENGENGEYAEYAAPLSFSLTGYLGEVSQADDYSTVLLLDAEGDVQMVLLLHPGEYFVIDAVTGQPADLEDHAGGNVIVFYGPITTRSYPPQSNARIIAVNADELEFTRPNHHKIEAIEHDGDNLVLTVDGGGLYVTLTEDTELDAWLTRQIVVLDEFQVGDEVLLWYGFVAMSFPAQAVATRALRLVPAPHYQAIEPYDLDEDPYDEPYDEPEYPAEEAELLGRIERAGVGLYRVGLNAEAAGFATYWNNELRRAELTYGDTVIIISPGSAVFYVNGEAHTMSVPALLENDRLFAPADFFDYL